MQASVSSTSGFIWHQHSLQQASFVWLIYDYESKNRWEEAGEQFNQVVPVQ